MPIELADRISNVKPSATLAVNARANELRSEGKEIINLSAGEPDFNTPEFIKQAAIEAIQEDFTRYTAVDGTMELKQAVIHKFMRDNQLTYELNQILVSSGAKQSLYNLSQVILNPGDEALIPAPYWVSYPQMVNLTGATPIIINSTIDDDYKITAEQLTQYITPKTRLLFLNSPNNPSGMVYSKAELAALGEVLKQHPQIIIASDDIYEYILWGDQPYANILNACPELSEQTIIINGLSKAYCMTGWRLGYCAGNPAIIAAMKKLQSQSTSNPNSITQKAAVVALHAEKEHFFVPMLKEYQQRHDWIVPQLNQLGFTAKPTNGAFYVFINAEQIIAQLKLANDVELAKYLLEKAQVALVPGTAFGMPGHLRLSYVTSMQNLQQAIENIKKAIS